MNRLNKLIIGMFCALSVAICGFAADTTVKATNAAIVVETVKAHVEKSWEVTFGGVGFTGVNNFGDGWQWGGELGISKIINLGFKLDKPIKTDLGARQSLSYGNVSGGDSWCILKSAPGAFSHVVICGTDEDYGWMLRSELFWDWNVTIYKGLSLFVGPNVAFDYGNIHPQWTVGPEAGFKYDFNKTWFAFTRANYDLNVSHHDDGFRVGAGFGFRF